MPRHLFCLAALVMFSDHVAGKEADNIQPADETGFVALFDGKTFDGWSGGDMSLFRLEDGAVVAGTMKKKIERNEFLTSKKEYADFELRLQTKLIGEGGNAGIQIRSQRIPDHHEMIGYQVDMGKAWDNVWWGKLYDESRRRKILAAPDDVDALEKLVRWDDWNDYRIRCEGKRVQIWLNGTKTVDYTEPDEKIKQTGLIGLQIHGGPPSEAWYKNIRIKQL